MSIFIAELAFKANDAAIASVKIGILLASLLSGIIGALFLLLTSKPSVHNDTLEETSMPSAS